MVDAENNVSLLVTVGVAAFALTMSAMAHWVLPWLERRQTRELEDSTARVQRNMQIIFHQATADRPPPTLEEEISNVSGTLTRTVTRLRDISVKAKAYEAEVHELVRHADAAQAAAQLNEEQAQKIALLLTSQTEQKLKEELDKLTKAHQEQIDGLKKAGSRTAWITFVLGAVIGFLLNLLTAYLMG